MQANSSNLKICIHIDKQNLRNEKYFVYQKKRYPIDFDLLIKNSNYFYKNRKQYENADEINIVNENENVLNISEEAIEAFVSSCQNQECQISISSVIPLQYLSYKFEFPELLKTTKAIYNEHCSDVIIRSLLFKKEFQEETGFENENEKIFFDTKQEEEIVSENIEKYINNDQMLDLSIPVLSRIIGQSKKKPLKDLINFLFKALDRHGIEASILFNNIDFGELSIDVFNRLLNEYSDKFDFNMINSTLVKTTTQISREMSKQKEEYANLFNEMRNEFRLQQLEMKNQFEQQKKEILKLKEEIVSRDIEEEKRKQKYQQIILETISVDEFRKFNDEIKNHIINQILEMQDKFDNQKIDDNKPKLVQMILFCDSIYQMVDFSNENIKSLNQFINKLFEEDGLAFKHDIIERLYYDNFLYSFITKYAQLCKCDVCITVNIELNYQSKSFDDIIKAFFEFKQKNLDLSKQIKLCMNILTESGNQQMCQLKIDLLEENAFHKYPKSILSSNRSNLLFHFEKCTYLTQISIPPIQLIPFRFFRKCCNLSNVVIPSSVKFIEGCAFLKCSSLKQITIPNTVTSIGFRAFKECTSLSQISIPSSVTDIADEAFSKCSSLQQIIIPSSIRSINNKMFNKCTSLKKVIIQTSGSKIGRKSFNKCSSLERIIIPSSVTRIEEFAFAKCSSLIEVSIPSSVTRIEKFAFAECSSLIEVSIPSSLTNIGAYSFWKCSSISSIKIPSSVTSIEYHAFDKCLSLIEVSISSSITEIDSSVFFGCSSLEKIIIPSSVTSIGRCAFGRCLSLKQITIPSSVTEIKCGAFNACSSLNQIIIPSSVTSIESSAFCGNSSMTQVIIPSSVTSLSSALFYGCNSLRHIEIPSSVTEIESDVFRNCSSLEEIVIPPSVTSIGDNVFDNCSSLKQISIPPSVTSIGEFSFYECSSLTQISIPTSVASIGNQAFGKCDSLREITVPSSIKLDDLGIDSNVKVVMV